MTHLLSADATDSTDRGELPTLSPDEVVRYGRHIIIPEIGVTGQRRLKAGRALLVGAGGLGSPLALYLAAAGVGTLGLVDFDVVDLSNLQRQVLHGTADIGRRKLDSARERIHDINPHVHVEAYATRLTSDNALEILADYDILVDGTDNFPTRYLTNDACVILGKPNVYGSVSRFEGQASVFAPGHAETRSGTGPCYRCLFREPPPPGTVPSCAEAGVLGVLPGLIGTIQATETIKLILGIGSSLIGRLLLVNALTMAFRTVGVHRDPDCPACGTREIRELADYEAFCSTAGAVPDITPRHLARRLRDEPDLDLIDVREPYEWSISRIPGARHIPLGSFAEVLPSLDRGREVVVYCKVGGRSAAAVKQLQAAGFPRVWNLAGGISRWRDEVDPAMRTY